MTPTPPESEVQDYLDDRMSASERQAFERRLAAEAALAARVRSGRERARALREDAPQLPPGFYTRLRARFERERTPPRRWFLPLSWETAGLIASLVVVAILFWPYVGPIDDEGPLPPSAGLEGPAPDDFGDEAAARVPSGRGSVEDRAGIETAEAEPVAPAAGVAAPAPAGQRKAEPEGAPREEAQKNADVRLRQRAEAPLESAPDLREKAPPNGPPQPSAAARADEPSIAPSRGAARRDLDATTPVGLPAGVVGPGTIVEVDSVETWSRLSLGPAGEALEALGGPEATTRIVLVGVDPGTVDCAASTVELRGESYELRLARRAAAPGAPLHHGCAFRLPRDGRPARLGEGGAR